MEKIGSDDELFGLDETCIPDNTEDNDCDKNSLSYDEVLLHRLKTSISGVPPPPLFTHPQQNIDDILNYVKNSHHIHSGKLNSLASDATATSFSSYSVFSREKVEEVCRYWKNYALSDCRVQLTGNDGMIRPNSEARIRCLLNDISHFGMAKTNLCIFYDIGYNIGKLSEKIAVLFDKYRDRYVGCETASFVTANSPSNYFGKKKEGRKLIGKSPGRRILYRKNRRKGFSSVSLQAANNPNSLFGLNKRTILIEKGTNKKEENKRAKRALFTSPEDRKTLKLDFLKQSTSRLKLIEMRRSLWMRRKFSKKGTPRKQTPKKNLTPNKQTTSSNKPISKKSLTPEKLTLTNQFTLKNSFSTKKCTPDGEKRKENSITYESKIMSQNESILSKDIVNENFKRCKSQSNSNCDSSMNGQYSTSYPTSDNSKAENDVLELSDTQRRKLLWAVSAALKQVGIGTDHSDFRACGRKLYKMCKTLWTNSLISRSLKKGISEHMLSLASEHVQTVIKEVREQSSDIELCNQDSNSCDFFLKINESSDE